MIVTRKTRLARARLALDNLHDRCERMVAAITALRAETLRLHAALQSVIRQVEDLRYLLDVEIGPSDTQESDLTRTQDLTHTPRPRRRVTKKREL